MDRRYGQLERRMAMRRGFLTEGGGGTVSPKPFVDFQIVGGVFKDVVSGVVYNSTPLAYTQDGFVYNSGTKHQVLFVIPVDGVLRYVYPNEYHKWSGGVAPNPPTNGVSPEYFGEGLRLVATLYCTTLVNDSRANGSAIVACLSHNNANYVGFNVSMKGNISSFYLNRYIDYRAPNVSVGPVTIVQNSARPLRVQIDMSETQYRIKLFEYGSTVAIGDSGLQSSSFGTSSRRYYPLGTSNAGQEVSTYPTVYVQSYQYYKESVLPDFLG